MICFRYMYKIFCDCQTIYYYYYYYYYDDVDEDDNVRNDYDGSEMKVFVRHTAL